MRCFNSSKLISLFFLFALITFSVKSQTEVRIKHLVKGKVTHDSLPLTDVNILVKNTDIGTKTNKNGDYILEVFKKDTLQFTYLGYATVEIEGNEDIFNIEMVPETYMLEETVLKKVKSKPKDLEEKYKSFSTSKENIDPRTVGYKMSYIDDDLSSYPTLTSALLARAPSYRAKLAPDGNSMGFIRGLPVLWDVDGYVTDVEPILIIENIKDIRILGTAAAVNYGMRCKGLGGVGDMRSCGSVIKIKMKKTFKKERTPEEKKRIDNILNSIKNTYRKKKDN